MTDQAPLIARRDRLHLELTAAWARIARREARPEEIAAYYRKQAEYQMACDLLAEPTILEAYVSEWEEGQR